MSLGKLLNWEKNSVAETGDGEALGVVPGRRRVRQKAVGVTGAADSGKGRLGLGSWERGKGGD